MQIPEVFPYAGITRIRFKGYDLSHFANGTPIRQSSCKFSTLFDAVKKNYCLVIY
jgi:hypothetical protein